MADDFGTAIYTNCAPGQGIDGVGGMQFQSHSPEVNREALTIIRRHLIYEPPERLIRERQPIEVFPPSFAHVYEDGIFATAAGIYLGREADGTRPGNHLTHAIVTSDPRAYRTVRPAQLFRASFWRTKPAPTTQTEPLAASWEPGPLDAAEVGRFVNAQPDGAALLTALLAALLANLKHNRVSASRRVLLISEHPEPVLQWLTAATLLIPLPEALRVGFKVFSTDPARSAMPVVAVHPDWARSIATVEDDRGYAVFDLPRNRWTQVPEPPEAKHWVKLFGEADPYDLNEMVELAAASGLTGDTAYELAAAAVLGHTPSSANVGALVDWLRSGPRALHEAYSGRLIGVLTRLNDRGLMRRIDDITRDRFPARNHATTLSLLRLELEHASAEQAPSWPVRGDPPGASDYGKRVVPAAAEPEAAQLVARYLRQARGAAFDAVLRVSAQFGVSVPLGDTREAAAAFVTYWADNPAAGYDPRAWPQEPPVHDMLVDELSDRILHGPSSATTIADKWWNRLPGWDAEHADITSPLQRVLLSAAVAYSKPRTRLHIVEANLGHGAVTGAYRELAHVLWARTQPTMEELRALCRLVPAGMDLEPDLFTDLVDRATGETPGLAELALCDDLAEKQLLVPNAAMARLLFYHHQIQSLESRLAAGYPPPDVDKLLREVPPSLLISHGERLTHSLLALHDPVWVIYLVRQLPLRIVGRYLRAWCDQSLWSFGPDRVAVSFALSRWVNWAAAGARSDLRFGLDAFLRDWCRRAPARDTSDVAARLEPLGPELVNSWSAHVARNRPGRLRRLRQRWDRLWPFRQHPDV